MPLQYNEILVLHSLKPWNRTGYNINLRKFLDFCDEEETTIERSAQFDCKILRYTHCIFNYTSREGRGHVRKVLCALTVHIREKKDKLPLSYSAMNGLDSRKAQPAGDSVATCPYAVHCLLFAKNRLIENSLAALLSFDCHLLGGETTLLTKRKAIFEKAPTPGLAY